MRVRLDLTLPDETSGMPLQGIQLMDALDKAGKFACSHVDLSGKELRPGEALKGWFSVFPGVRVEYILTRIYERH